MAEGTYVKLTEDQISLQNITPGELNQPIDLVKLHERTCERCGQVIPASYTPPADENWATGIFGCLEDSDSCLTGLFCPCVLFGRNIGAFGEEMSEHGSCVWHAVCVEGGIAVGALTAAFNGGMDPNTVCLLTEGLLFAWWVCAIYTGMGRQMLQRKYHLEDAPCDPCMVHCCFHWCAICQERREMNYHLSQECADHSTMVDPPQLQEMIGTKHNGTDHRSSSSSNHEQRGHTNLELQPI